MGQHCARFGGFEIAAMWILLGSAARRVAIVVDDSSRHPLSSRGARVPCPLLILIRGASIRGAGACCLLSLIGQQPILHLGMRLCEVTGQRLRWV